MTVPVNLAGEGMVDLAIMRRLLDHVGLTEGHVYCGEGRVFGKDQLTQRVPGYAQSARRGNRWFVLRDLDRDADCAAALINGIDFEASAYFCFRIAVRAAEAWLLADRDHIAPFLSVAPAWITPEPEAVDDPKGHIVAIAGRSRKPTIKNGFQPRPRSGRATGPDYASQLSEFARTRWDVGLARQRCDSLDRTLRCLERFRVH